MATLRGANLDYLMGIIKRSPSGFRVVYSDLIGLVLKRRRKRLGRTQARVGVDASVLQCTVSRIENGGECEISTFAVICNAIGLAPSEALLHAERMENALKREGLTVIYRNLMNDGETPIMLVRGKQLVALLETCGE